MVTWWANGKPLHYSQLSFSANNSSKVTSCGHDGSTPPTDNPTYIEQLEIGLMEEGGAISIELQCVSIFSCRNYTGSCVPSICHGPLIELNSKFSGSQLHIIIREASCFA